MKNWYVVETSIWIQVGFFRVENTVDCFCEAGRWPSTRDLLNRYTRNGAKSSRTLIEINGGVGRVR